MSELAHCRCVLVLALLVIVGGLIGGVPMFMLQNEVARSRIPVPHPTVVQRFNAPFYCEGPSNQPQEWPACDGVTFKGPEAHLEHSPVPRPRRIRPLVRKAPVDPRCLNPCART